MNEYRPKFANHVAGWFEDRRFDPETHQPEETPCGAKCEICNESFEKMCLSGLFKTHINNFALSHMHRDPFAREGGRRT